MRRPLNLLLLVLVIAFGVSLWLAQGKPWPAMPGRSAPPESREPVSLVKATLEPVHLRILNGTEELGLAGDMALLITRLGYVVEGVGNAEQWPGTGSILVNRRLSAARAAELAKQLGGIPVLKEWDGRTTEDAVLILGVDYQDVRRHLDGSSE